MDYESILPLINYPQEVIPGQQYKYRCRYCCRSTLDIGGRLEGHADDCEYRLQMLALIDQKRQDLI